MGDTAPYSLFEHTADIGMDAYGRTVEEAFENAAKGMFAIITDGSPIDPKIKEIVSLPYDAGSEQLIIDWLSELLYLFEVTGLVFGKFKVSITDKFIAEAWGEPYSRKKHGYGEQIKAVTYHLLQIKKNKKGVYIRVLFDI